MTGSAIADHAAVAAPGAEESPAVFMEAVRFAYVSGPRPAVENVTMSIGSRDLVVIVGPNGGGKTTLLKLMLGLIEPDEGRIEVLGRPPRASRSRIGYVPQRREIDGAVPATVLDIVLTGRLAHARWGFRHGRHDVERAREALHRVDAGDLVHRRISSLSGGQRQRVLIARALAGDASLLLLDEPEAGVDARASDRLGDLLDDLNRDLPIIVVSHHAGFIRSDRKRVARLDRQLDWVAAGPDGHAELCH